MAVLIADSGSTKTEWCLLEKTGKKKILTQGLSPYFLTHTEMAEILRKELLPRIKGKKIQKVVFYGTGCSQAANKNIVRSALADTLGKVKTEIDHDLLAAARALCGKDKGMVCILGTGSNSCFFNGKTITKNIPGLGFILGDEGSGAYLGRKIIQHYLYNTFDEDLMDRFTAKFGNLQSTEILDAVYRRPFPNRYLASFSVFLSENRGHYMIENILEDSFSDFFFHHLFKYRETWTHPVHFVGSIAHVFRDKIREFCESQEINCGVILKEPMEGLIKFHR